MNSNVENMTPDQWDRQITAYLEELRQHISNNLQEHVAQFDDARLESFLAEIQTSRVLTIQTLAETTRRLGALLEFWSAAEHAVESVRIARRNAAAAATARYGVN